jgi:superfamily II DNA or RNA helicase
MSPDKPTQRSIEEIEKLWAAYDESFTSFLPHQVKVLEDWQDLGCEGSHLIFHPPGKGKTVMSLTEIAMAGYGVTVVVAPPITHNKWVKDGKAVGIKVIPVSHAKFRMPDFRLLRNTPLIVDEFHLLGGHTGKGWTKLDAAARGMKAPLILASATPNYNDAERCYCLVHVLSPWDHKGGYIGWLYRNCNTQENPFRKEPDVLGFYQFKDAADYLAAQPRVSYLPDDAPDILQDLPVSVDPLPPEFFTHHVDETRERVMASGMEIRQRESYRYIVQPDGHLTEGIAEMLGYLIGQMPEGTKWLVFCQRSEIAKAVYRDSTELADLPCAYIDGDVSKKVKDAELQRFLTGDADILIGTASLATGTDGIDKVCKLLVIVDDTDDDSLRYQLIGRVLPRGVVTQDDYVGRVAYRFTY